MRSERLPAIPEMSTLLRGFLGEGVVWFLLTLKELWQTVL